MLTKTLFERRPCGVEYGRAPQLHIAAGGYMFRPDQDCYRLVIALRLAHQLIRRRRRMLIRRRHSSSVARRRSRRVREELQEHFLGAVL